MYSDSIARALSCFIDFYDDVHVTSYVYITS
jgi:hypothetical protein